MNYLEAALKLAEQGFHVFPLVPGAKTPAVSEWQKSSTRDPDQIRAFWLDPVLELVQPYNIGIDTAKFGDDGECLIVLDVDNKVTKKGKVKNGEEGIIELALDGKELPPTYMQSTPTGGRHLVYRSRIGRGNSAGTLATGIDVRSIGGLLVGAGSRVGSGTYCAELSAVAEAPAWLSDGGSEVGSSRQAREVQAPVPCNPDLALARAVDYLQVAAPVSIEGEGGNQTAYLVAARLKDLGLDSFSAYDCLMEHWNDRCEPPWSGEELVQIVENAYAYGKSRVGAAAPEADFQPVVAPVEESATSPGPVAPLADPISKFNSSYAFVITGSTHCILHETVDEKGQPLVAFLEPGTFHAKHAAETMVIGKGVTPITKAWMNSPRRRSFDGVCFLPGKQPIGNYYNLFKGFAVEPMSVAEAEQHAAAQRGLQNYLDHVRENICRGDEGLYRWVIGYLAHLFQRPWERPGVALVLRGTKGVGKNAFVDTIGHLLGANYLLTSKQRYLTGQFNSHLQNLLMFTLDEAFWSGAKDIEGILKDLITGTHHVIERKGLEPYRVDNCLRLVILGNEDWLVPASDDERRYAVLDVGEGRKQDIAFFEQMRLDMEAGGYRLLLRYLLDQDLSGINVKKAPQTLALRDQKLLTLAPIHQWWLECLSEGELVGVGEWREQVPKDAIRAALKVYWRDRNIKGRMPEARGIGLALSKCFELDTGQVREDGKKQNTYRLPALAEARKAFEKYIGHEVTW